MWKRKPALVAIACGACGSVENEPPPVDAPGVRAIECNGSPLDVLENGNFDALDPPWRQDPPSPSLLCGQPLIAPDSGAVAGCLGGSANASVSTLSRDVLLPAGTLQARLTGKLCISTEEIEPLPNDVITFDILDGGATIGSLGRRTNEQGAVNCSFASFNFEAPLTRDPVIATLRIQSNLDNGRATTFFVDTLALSIICL